MKKKKVLSIVLAAAMIAGLTAGCGSDSGSGEGGSEEAKGKVYYLNFKPEADEYWQELAETYTDETGVPVTVLTAASGEYEKTLKSEMAKTDAPAVFQVNGPVGLASWKDYCYDLSDSDIAGELTDDSFALMDGDKMAGIAYVVENYATIYNKALLEQAGYTADDITDFDSFKEVVEDITARKDELGFSAFTSAGMDGSSDWRFKTHLANLPIYYEYKDEGIDTTDAIKGTYLDNYRQIWDLYINNATCAPTEISTKTADDATAEFVTEEAVFYQNGTWEYNNIADVGDENLGILPIYIGVEGEQDFDIVKEDLKFLNDCLKTVLKSYGTYFRERYVEGQSVRKYAEAHNMNRGSVDHLNRKFIAELAAALKARDDADGVCRLHKRK